MTQFHVWSASVISRVGLKKLGPCTHTSMVVIRPLNTECIFHVNRKLKQVLLRMRETIGHENVAKFFGISAHSDTVYVVEQYCVNGTLVDFIATTSRKYNSTI